MHKSVIESYPQLWHYTTAHGLQGILTNQQLWATNIFYLNDGEEFTGFFNRKLPHLLKEGFQEGIAEARKTEKRLSLIDAADDLDAIEKSSNDLLSALRAATLSLPVYIASFCCTPSEPESEDGLLSQWRGYGVDGGYAIVFDTNGLNELLLEEQRRFFYSFGHWGDVDYYDGKAGVKAAHEETLKWEATIRETLASLVLKQSPDYEAFYEPIVSLATRHKHQGFREEREVRIVTLPLHDDLIREAQKEGENRLKKMVHFTPRGGVLVPHIALFERPTGDAAKLPIKKIIVGPHSEKLKRQKAVEILLDQLGIETKVVVSDIPYLGR
jgi:hypothetical protein